MEQLPEIEQKKSVNQYDSLQAVRSISSPLVIPQGTFRHSVGSSVDTDLYFILPTNCTFSIWSLVVPSQTSWHRQDESPETDFILLLTTSCTFSIRYISCSITDVQTQEGWISRDILYLITHHKQNVQHLVHWLFHHRRRGTGPHRLPVLSLSFDQDRGDKHLVHL